MIITSSSNAVFKNLMKLKDKKNRDRQGVFVAEGLRFVNEIPKEVCVEEYVVSENFPDTDCLREDTKVIRLADNLFRQLSDTDSPQGVMAVCKKLKADEDVLRDETGFYIIAEEINDPGNLGTIIRTADACGANAVFLSRGSVDLYNSKVLRSTMGSLFHLPIITDVAIADVVSEMKERGISVYAAHLKGEKYPQEMNFKKGCAFVFGNEARGLKDETAALCDEYVKIPMPGKAESLNLSVAAAMLMYETVRQRIGR